MTFEIKGEMWFFVVLLIGCFIVLGICIGFSIQENKIVLSQETANKVCSELTEIEGAIAIDYKISMDNQLVEKGELYCQIPSYDETHLIKIGK